VPFFDTSSTPTSSNHSSGTCLRTRRTRHRHLMGGKGRSRIASRVCVDVLGGAFVGAACVQGCRSLSYAKLLEGRS
jgi:hypothetical protein